jgi:serine O-acetyltransferase
MLTLIREDIQAARAKDPAARGWLEIVICYPGLQAIWIYRVAHWLWERGLKFSARVLSHLGRFLTGVEIHPAAEIGRRLFIDHGMGIVIGETAELGNDCVMFKGVVLGGVSTEKKKRHPTLGNRVVVGTNACVLGPIEIGDDVMIGSGSVVIRSAPSGCTVVGVPGRVVNKQEKRRIAEEMNHGSLPDPVADALRVIMDEQRKMDERLRKLEHRDGSCAKPER